MGKIAGYGQNAMAKASAKLPNGTKMPDPRLDLGKPEDELLNSIAVICCPGSRRPA